jgi:hypothetical protein
MVDTFILGRQRHERAKKLWATESVAVVVRAVTIRHSALYSSTYHLDQASACVHPHSLWGIHTALSTTMYLPR